MVVAVVMWVAGRSPGRTPPWTSRTPRGHLVTAQDARSYYGLDLADLYEGRTDWNTIGAYPYSPAFAQLVYPLDLLPWPVFVAAWTAILIGAVYLITGPDLFLLGLAVGAMEIAGGNISLLLTLAIVAGFRRPWTWAFVLLTKITPGIGLLWFALRREWRPLAIALGATAAVVAVSFVLMPPGLAGLDLAPRREHRQGRHLGGGARSRSWSAARSASCAHLGRVRNQRGVVPIAAMLALPALWYGSLSMVLGVIPLTTPERAVGAGHACRVRPSRRPRAHATQGIVTLGSPT